jgi:hypothetical protein
MPSPKVVAASDMQSSSTDMLASKFVACWSVPNEGEGGEECWSVCAAGMHLSMPAPKPVHDGVLTCTPAGQQTAPRFNFEISAWMGRCLMIEWNTLSNSTDTPAEFLFGPPK